MCCAPTHPPSPEEGGTGAITYKHTQSRICLGRGGRVPPARQQPSLGPLPLSVGFGVSPPPAALGVSPASPLLHRQIGGSHPPTVSSFSSPGSRHVCASSLALPFNEPSPSSLDSEVGGDAIPRHSPVRVTVAALAATELSIPESFPHQGAVTSSMLARFAHALGEQLRSPDL